MGSNMAEAHPVGFRFPIKARERGATLIHVDPRFSRTSAMCDIWVPLRAGSDIVLLGGLINYVLDHHLELREYVVAYTNAATIIGADFRDTEDLAGFFSGWDDEHREYSSTSWAYEGSRPKKDPSLEDSRCVFQILKRHFARYTPEMVE